MTLGGPETIRVAKDGLEVHGKNSFSGEAGKEHPDPGRVLFDLGRAGFRR